MTRPYKKNPNEIKLKEAMLTFAQGNKDDPETKQAFNEVARLARPILRQFLIGKGARPHNVDDFIQNTLITVWTKLSETRKAKFNGASAKSWLFETAYREHASDLKRAYNRRKCPPPQDDNSNDIYFWDSIPDEGSPLPNEEVQSQEISKIIDDAITHETLRLHFIEDLKYEEISERQGIALGTVQSRINRNKKKLLQTVTPLLCEYS